MTSTARSLCLCALLAASVIPTGCALPGAPAEEKVSMSQLTIVAHITAQPDHIDLVKAELLKLIPPTLAEAGCIQYDLHQDNENPAYFLFFENWESRELWQAHMESDHLKAFVEVTEGKLEKLEVSEMSRVN